MEHKPVSPKKDKSNKTITRWLVGGFIALCIIGLIAGAASTKNTAAKTSGTNIGSSSSPSGSNTNSGSGSSSGSGSGSGSGGSSTTGSSDTTGSGSSTSGNSCYPMSDENTCYEPGEYCRDSDAGTSGIAGDGKSITCEDNDGLRWEPN